MLLIGFGQWESLVGEQRGEKQGHGFGEVPQLMSMSGSPSGILNGFTRLWALLLPWPSRPRSDGLTTASHYYQSRMLYHLLLIPLILSTLFNSVLLLL